MCTEQGDAVFHLFLVSSVHLQYDIPLSRLHFLLIVRLIAPGTSPSILVLSRVNRELIISDVQLNTR